MCDIIDYNFIGQHDHDGNAIPFRPGNIPKPTMPSFENSSKPIKLEGNSGTAEDEWMFRQILHRGFLIAKGCQASAVLSETPNQPANIQKSCFELGKYLYLTWQIFVQTEFFKRENFNSDIKIDLVSLPVLFHLNHDPSLYDVLIKDSETREGIDQQVLFDKILNGPGMEPSIKMITKLKCKTQSYLQDFAASDEKLKIENILNDFVATV